MAQLTEEQAIKLLNTSLKSSKVKLENNQKKQLATFIEECLIDRERSKRLVRENDVLLRIYNYTRHYDHVTSRIQLNKLVLAMEKIEKDQPLTEDDCWEKLDFLKFTAHLRDLAKAKKAIIKIVGKREIKNEFLGTLHENVMLADKLANKLMLDVRYKKALPGLFDRPKPPKNPLQFFKRLMKIPCVSDTLASKLIRQSPGNGAK